MIRIVHWDPGRADHRTGFRELNLAWISRHFVVEPADLRQLDDPEGAILGPGGAILMAERGGGTDRPGEVVGTCALVAEPGGAFELAKMAVAEAARGHGVGRLLGEAAIVEARRRGATRLELMSNTALQPAISLYRALGFAEVPLAMSDYARANIRMVLEL